MPLRYEVYDGFDLPTAVWRIVSACPPTLEDFGSYASLGRNFPSYNYFRAAGVSMYLTEEGARAANAKYQLGSNFATLNLLDNRFLWALTGGENHITVWATPAALLERVVTCT